MAKSVSSRSWKAYFTTGIPPETLALFALVLESRADPGSGTEEPDSVMAALTARGWRPDVRHPGTTAWDAAVTSGFTCMLPALIQDQDPHEGLPGWQAWAEPKA